MGKRSLYRPGMDAVIAWIRRGDGRSLSVGAGSLPEPEPECVGDGQPLISFSTRNYYKMIKNKSEIINLYFLALINVNSLSA